MLFVRLYSKQSAMPVAWQSFPPAAFSLHLCLFTPCLQVFVQCLECALSTKSRLSFNVDSRAMQFRREELMPVINSIFIISW
uniref:Putative secreted protein n=1 Tax=Amblyomma cajennense TaxID=34607 RepID=A0A023FBC2_AMBCJ